jgi:hypothetical protein
MAHDLQSDQRIQRTIKYSGAFIEKNTGSEPVPVGDDKLNPEPQRYAEVAQRSQRFFCSLLHGLCDLKDAK